MKEPLNKHLRGPSRIDLTSLVVEDGGVLNGRCTTVKAQPALEPELGRVRRDSALEFGPEFELEEES